MSSGTNRGKDSKPATIGDLNRKLEKLCRNLAEEFNKTNSRSYSVAMCFDALITVLDKRRRQGTPSIADAVKALLSEMTKQAPVAVAAEEKKPDENTASNKG